MKTDRAFKPSATDRLESRDVPSAMTSLTFQTTVPAVHSSVSNPYQTYLDHQNPAFPNILVRGVRPVTGVAAGTSNVSNPYLTYLNHQNPAFPNVLVRGFNNSYYHSGGGAGLPFGGGPGYGGSYFV